MWDMGEGLVSPPPPVPSFIPSFSFLLFLFCSSPPLVSYSAFSFPSLLPSVLASSFLARQLFLSAPTTPSRVFSLPLPPSASGRKEGKKQGRRKEGRDEGRKEVAKKYDEE